jgi:hypothetical protein
MSNEHENGSSAASERVGGSGGIATELEQEVVRLRAQLAEATADAERYRRAAYALLNERVPYTPPTEEELRDLLHGPRGRPLTELIDELEREEKG